MLDIGANMKRRIRWMWKGGIPSPSPLGSAWGERENYMPVKFGAYFCHNFVHFGYFWTPARGGGRLPPSPPPWIGHWRRAAFGGGVVLAEIEGGGGRSEQ